MPFTPALECIIRKVQESQKRLRLNGTHLFLFYVGDVNLFGDNISIIYTNIVELLVASKEDGLELNAEKAKRCIYVRVLPVECMAILQHDGSPQILGKYDISVCVNDK